jgi:carboxylesterase type B
MTSSAFPSVDVKLSTGSIRGYTVNGVNVFRGVPYARAPIGALRFKRAAPVDSWTETLDCTRDRAIALQPNLNMHMLFFSVPQLLWFGLKTFVWGYGWNANVDKPQPVESINSAFAACKMSEDCLYLQVHAPVHAAKKLPVMVWFHGGAAVQGAGCSDMWAPSTGSRLSVYENVVTVYVNYRLGAAGWLPVDGGDTNCGLSDAIESLRWVQREIAQFGGDPANVTLFGESFGAMLIAAIMVAPPAKGLYQRAIWQSGGATCISPAQASRLNESFAQVLGLERCTLATLATVDSSKLLAAQTAMLRTKFKVTGMMAFEPCVDGDLLPDFPQRLIREGKANASAMIIGWNRDENAFFRKVRPGKPTDSVELLRRRFVSACGAGAEFCFETSDDETQQRALADDVIAAAYADFRARRNLPALEGAALAAALETLDVATLNRIYDDWCGWTCFAAPSIIAADGMRKAGADVFLYQFDFESAFFNGAAHALELPFVHGTSDLFPSGFTGLDGARSTRLSRQLMRAFANFARTGNPNQNPTAATARPVAQAPVAGWLPWAWSFAAPLLPARSVHDSPVVMTIDCHDPGNVDCSGWLPWQSIAKPAIMHFDVDRAPTLNASPLPRAAVLLTELRRNSIFTWGGPPLKRALEVAW